MPATMMPLSEETKRTILDEHPQGLWIVLGEDVRQDDVPDEVPLVGHPTTIAVHNARCDREPR